MKDFGNVEIYQVDSNLTGENSPLTRIGEIAERVKQAGGRLCLNLDGGMNYMIAAAAMQLEPFRPLYVQSSQERSVRDSADESFTALRLPETLPVADILALQNVPYRIDKDFRNDNLDKWFKIKGISAPQNCLRNVKIDNFTFEYVWNPGNNRLNFFKDWRVEGEHSPEYYKERDRDFAHWSTDRKRCGQLYDKRVFALAYDRKTIQRLEENSNGQISVLDYNDGRLIDVLQEKFAAKAPKVKENKLAVSKAEEPLVSLHDNALIVCMGTNLPATLAAIASHKPDHVVLCWSPGNALVRKYAERTKEAASRLGLKSVQLVKLREEGAHCESLLPPVEEGARVLVNVSPGTKGQSAMLARWTLRHGHEVWSLNNNSRCASPLAGVAPETPCPALDFPDLPLYFEILGREMSRPGTLIDGIEAHYAWLDAMLAFMRRSAAAGKDINDAFSKRSFAVGADKLQYIGNNKYEITVDGRSHKFIKQEGKWFEKLCARALQNAGAKHVRLNVAMKWNEENSRKAAANHDADKAESIELDVVGIFEGHIVLISAKDHDLEAGVGPMSFEKAMENARVTGSNFGRFALSLLASLGSPKKMVDERVELVGWEDLCEPEKLKQHVRKLAKRQSSTN